MSSATRITIVEDDVALRDIWMRALNSEPDFRLLGCYGDGASALAALLKQPGDLVLVDWNLPGMDGIEIVRRLKGTHPEVRAILITGHDLADLPFEAFAAGVDGFLTKPVPITELPLRLREGLSGKCPVSAEVSRLLVERLRSTGALQTHAILAPMETKVLELFAEGLDTKSVAERLNISPHTVVTHKRRAFEKLHAHNLAGALRLWSRPAPPTH